MIKTIAQTQATRPAFELSAAQDKAAGSGLHWRIPIKAAAMRARDYTDARRVRREYPGALGESCARMIENSAPVRKLTPTAIVVAAEIARRERMQVCAEHRTIGGVDRVYVRAAVSTLAAWCQRSKSAIEVALDRLEDSGELIRIRIRRPHPAGDGRTVRDSSRYRIAWWARERWGLPAVDGLSQALLTLRESEPAPGEDPRAADRAAPPKLELTDRGIAEAVDRHMAAKWRDLGRMYERQGIDFVAFREAEINRLESEPVEYLRAVLKRTVSRPAPRAATGDPGRPPPGAS